MSAYNAFSFVVRMAKHAAWPTIDIQLLACTALDNVRATWKGLFKLEDLAPEQPLTRK